MMSPRNTRDEAVSFIRGSEGEKITKDDLPTLGGRWTKSKKELVLMAIERGLISRDEACQTYLLTAEELDEWTGKFREWGRAGLSARRRVPQAGALLRKKTVRGQEMEVAKMVIDGVLTPEEAMSRYPFFDKAALEYWEKTLKSNN